MSSQLNERLPHAVLNLETRYLKAKKIEDLLSLSKKNDAINVLEIGTGSGGIAYYFANLSEMKCKVTAVDVVDSRLIFDGYDFQLVDSVKLPFEDEKFDVVISNHVIEHVGELDNQIFHLNELKRVLKNTGIGYLAVPNRWMLIEPHYKLIFLSWLPKKLRTPYLRLSKKGNYYDCVPLQKGEIESMFDKVDLKFKNTCVAALKLTFELEKPSSLTNRFFKFIPDYFLEIFTPVIPTLIYKIKKNTF